jgi:hypothetical protein
MVGNPALDQAGSCVFAGSNSIRDFLNPENNPPLPLFELPNHLTLEVVAIAPLNSAPVKIDLLHRGGVEPRNSERKRPRCAQAG